MRKMNYLLGTLGLGLGVLVGTLGMSLFTNSSSPASFISKLRGQESVQTVSGAASAPASTDLNAASGTAGTNSLQNSADSGVTQNLSSQGSAIPAQGQSGANQDSVQSYPIKQQIIADYKQDIGTFFGAWKSPDMATFRTKLAKAYTGDLFEKHARQAEEYLVQGIGLDVSQITFDKVDVESADTNTATLRVDYHYSARDFSLTDNAPIGEEHVQAVQVRVNLLKQNSHWMITGESAIR